MKKDNLRNRMKSYEEVSKTQLTKRIPVIIRLDGKAFHTFTKGFNKPYDEVMSQSMKKTMMNLCENIQGCVLGYTQSDEITLVLCDYKDIDTQPWFDYEVQKMCSISSSIATLFFNRIFLDLVNSCEENIKHRYITAIKKGAMFDSRVFNLPKEEVCNCLIWRQQDATRNSIQSLGQFYFSHKELQNKTCNEIQDMLYKEHNVNWNDCSTYFKRGCCCIKKPIEIRTKDNNTIIRNKWVVDDNIPIFTKNRDYIENRIIFI